MNSINLTGRLTADPELRRTGEGNAVCSYSIAVRRPMTKDSVDFIGIVSWRQSAEYLCQYGHKGDVVAVSGSLQSREWTDKEGKKHREWEVVTSGVELVLPKRDSQDQQGQYGQNSYGQGQQNYGGHSRNGYQGYQQGGQNQGYQSYGRIDGPDEQLPF